jgi:hypothetical protein
MPFGQALIAWRLLEGEKAAPQAIIAQKRSSRAKTTAVLLLLVSMIISNIVFFNLLGDRGLFGSAGIIFWANLLLLAASYVELLPAALQHIRMALGGNPLPGIAASSR